MNENDSAYSMQTEECCEYSHAQSISVNNKMMENGEHLPGRLRLRALGIRINLLEESQDWGDRSGA